MLANTETQFRFIDILNSRASQRSEQVSEDTLPSEMAAYLASNYGVSEETANKMVWGENYRLDPIEQKAIADGLDLQEDLFALIVKPEPSSKEILIHTLERVALNYLEPTECQGCGQLEALILESDMHSYRDFEIYHLVLDTLEHIVNVSKSSLLNSKSCPVPETYNEVPDKDFPLTPGDLVDETETINDWFSQNSSQSDLTPALIAAFENLNRNQQLELLALTYQKLNTSSEDSESIELVQTLLLLRNRYLTPLAKNVFDELVTGPKIGLSASDLIEKLNLSNRRSIGQLERSVNHSINKLNKENFEANLPNPLKTMMRGNEKHYLLDSDIIDSWKMVIKANKSATASVAAEVG